MPEQTIPYGLPVTLAMALELNARNAAEPQQKPLPDEASHASAIHQNAHKARFDGFYKSISRLIEDE